MNVAEIKIDVKAIVRTLSWEKGTKQNSRECHSTVPCMSHDSYITQRQKIYQRQKMTIKKIADGKADDNMKPVPAHGY